MKALIPLFLAMLLLVGCSYQVPTELYPKEPGNDEQQPEEGKSIITKGEAESIINKLIYFGMMGPDEVSIKSIEREGDDWIISLTTGYYYTMHGATGIIYCGRQEGQENLCHEAYVTFLDDSMIYADSETFSCVPAGPGTAADSSGMKCHQEVIDKYNSLKSQIES